MINCPECNSTEIETMDMLEIIDYLEQDRELNYYIAIYSGKCLSCDNEFTYEDTYTERKT